MSNALVPETIEKFVLDFSENPKMESLPGLCGNFFPDLNYHPEEETQFENEPISDCSISSDTTLHNMHSFPYVSHQPHLESSAFMYSAQYQQDVGSNLHQQAYPGDWQQCYPALADGYPVPMNAVKMDQYSPVHQMYDDYPQERGVGYRDVDTYDSDGSVEIASSIYTNVQIKTEQTSKPRLPAFGDIFIDRGRHSKGTGSRGRPVTYRRPGSNFVDSDDLDSEEDDHLSLCAGSSKVRRGAKNILLWKFLLEELASKKATHVQWVNRHEGTFKFVDTAECSKLWGLKKKKDDMNFEKLSRGIRHYYRDGLMSRLDGTRLVYKFNWDRVPKAFRKLAKVY